MAEYIERDKKRLARLRKEARQFQDDIVCAVRTDFMLTIAEAENRMIFDILNGLESIPAADVVEVVRCKDCERCEMCFPCKEFGKEAPPVYVCHLGCRACEVLPNDYCSFGVRKDEGE